MTHTAVIYTWPPDYLMAAYAARCLQALGLRPVLAIDAKDPRLVVEGVEVVRTAFARGGNLTGREFICGHLALCAELATSDLVLKVDSDTLLFHWPRIFRDPQAQVMGVWVPQMDGLHGCCYALRTAALPALQVAAAGLSVAAYLPEDRTIGQLAAALGPVHLPVHGQVETGFTSYRPDRSREPEWYRAHDVVLFPRFHKGDGVRREIATAMEALLP